MGVQMSAGSGLLELVQGEESEWRGRKSCGMYSNVITQSMRLNVLLRKTASQDDDTDPP